MLLCSVCVCVYVYACEHLVLTHFSVSSIKVCNEFVGLAVEIQDGIIVHLLRMISIYVNACVTASFNTNLPYKLPLRSQPAITIYSSLHFGVFIYLLPFSLSYTSTYPLVSIFCKFFLRLYCVLNTMLSLGE